MSFSGISSPYAGEVSLDAYKEAVEQGLLKVPEFEFIKQEAERLGIRVWLFGGTASSYAHYVRNDLERQTGDESFQAEHFNYDYMSIYRSTQDADLVVDGTARQALQFQRSLSKKYPHLKGSVESWEVRPLRESIGDKSAILGDFDFQNQHTDSQSVGLIEITDPPKKESRIRDARQWNKENPQFLMDVFEGKIHFYYSSKHKQTSRYKEGKNPPILSVVRYFIKVFQHELEIRKTDEKNLKKIIKDLNKTELRDHFYVSRWLEKHAKKLFIHASNIEYAAKVLDRFKLRNLLISLGDKDLRDSMPWWLNREPLKSFSVGKGNGRTFEEVAEVRGWKKELLPSGESAWIVSHGTSDLLAYESILRSRKGEPNVLRSRWSAVGEAAAFGEGFYTQVGLRGAGKTEITIRLLVDPNSREGSDFELGPDDMVIWQNRSAIKIVYESLEMSPLEYFDLLINEEGSFKSSDLGILEMFKRKLSRKILALSENEEKELVKLIRKVILNPNPNSNTWVVLDEWFRLRSSEKYPELLKTLINKEKKEASYDRRSLLQKIIFDNENLDRWNEDKIFEDALFLVTKRLYKDKDLRIVMTGETEDARKAVFQKFFIRIEKAKTEEMRMYWIDRFKRFHSTFLRELNVLNFYENYGLQREDQRVDFINQFRLKDGEFYNYKIESHEQDIGGWKYLLKRPKLFEAFVDSLGSGVVDQRILIDIVDALLLCKIKEKDDSAEPYTHAINKIISKALESEKYNRVLLNGATNLLLYSYNKDLILSFIDKLINEKKYSEFNFFLEESEANLKNMYGKDFILKLMPKLIKAYDTFGESQNFHAFSEFEIYLNDLDKDQFLHFYKIWIEKLKSEKGMVRFNISEWNNLKKLADNLDSFGVAGLEYIDLLLSAMNSMPEQGLEISLNFELLRGLNEKRSMDILKLVRRGSYKNIMRVIVEYVFFSIKERFQHVTYPKLSNRFKGYAHLNNRSIFALSYKFYDLFLKVADELKVELPVEMREYQYILDYIEQGKANAKCEKSLSTKEAS